MVEYDGIDYDYRPEALVDVERSSARFVVSRIKGSNRQEMVIDYLNKGAEKELSPTLLHESLPRESIKEMARFDPSFLGGEFLPDFFEDEVEIARLVLQTKHLDTISIRARPADAGAITCRVVDEYGTDFGVPSEPLPAKPSLREILELLERQDPELGGLLMVPLTTAIANGS
ncbi:MAG: hypothetical protein ACOCYG_09680, partial [Spirochaetota bacterium]